MRIFCSICKDIFIPYSEVLVTNCGHLYHSSCISTWAGKHKTCPQCRCSLSQQFRVYFDVDKDNAVDASTLEHELEKVSDKLRETEREKKNLVDEKKNFENIVEGMKECAISLSKKNDLLKTSVKALKEQVAKLTKKNEAITQLESEVKTWKAKVTTYERVDTLIKGSVEEVNKMVEDTPVTALAVKQLCTYVGILKLQLHKLEEKNCRLAKENRDLSRKVSEEKMKYSCDSEELNTLRLNNSKLERELFCLKMLHKDYKKKHTGKKEETLLCSSETTQVKVPAKKPTFDIDLDSDDEVKAIGPTQPLQSNKEINHWEELVCAGPSRNFGLSLKKSFSKTISNHKENVSRWQPCRTQNNGTNEDKSWKMCLNYLYRADETYAFDGFGGRKKLRLGGPTPREEFEEIKKKKEGKTPAPTVKHKKIIDYYQLD